MPKPKSQDPGEPQRLAAKIGDHELSITGSPDFIEKWTEWWQERVDDFELRKTGNGDGKKDEDD